MRNRKNHFAGLIAVSAVALLTLASGCGGTDQPPPPAVTDMATVSPFVGSWSGPLVQSLTTCSDGSTAPASSTTVAGLAITQSGAQVIWHANCGDISFTLIGAGITATQDRPITCAPRVSNGHQVTQTISAGHLSVNGNALSVDFNNSDQVDAIATCTSTESGTLARQ